MKKFPVKAICRAGIIAALYAVLTIYLGSIAYGPFQIRPAEALTLLPLLYVESIPALFVGCLIANLLSPYGVADIVVGSLVTLIAACLTYIIPRLVKNRFLRAALGGLFPVFLNAIILPVMWLIMGGMGSFWYNLLSMSCTQLVWVYVLGGPLYLAFERMSYSKRSPLYPTNHFVLRGRLSDKKKAEDAAADAPPQQN